MLRRPGDATPRENLEAALRVNHAGEYGAQQIYKGQLAILKDDASAPVLEEMRDQEVAHLQTFETLLNERRVRPTALMPFWHVAGYALGAGTALLGKRAAMACTVAVETVIAEHYQQQLDTLDNSEADLKQTIRQFRDDEMEHHAIGLEHEAENTPFYGLLSGAIQTGCKAAIWLSKRL